MTIKEYVYDGYSELKISTCILEMYILSSGLFLIFVLLDNILYRLGSVIVCVPFFIYCFILCLNSNRRKKPESKLIFDGIVLLLACVSFNIIFCIILKKAYDKCDISLALILSFIVLILVKGISTSIQLRRLRQGKMTARNNRMLVPASVSGVMGMLTARMTAPALGQNAVFIITIVIFCMVSLIISIVSNNFLKLYLLKKYAL